MPVQPQILLREAGIVLLLSLVLGFGHSAIVGKGVFGPEQPTAQPATRADVPPPEFIAYDEARVFFMSKDAVFIDSRHAFDYNLGHITGALNLPLKDFDTMKHMLDDIPKDRTVVSYCDGEECNSSIELAMKLQGLGFSNVKIFFGGWREWQMRGEPVEGSQP
jgi:rhodanese-related sulfurtransferase